MRLPRHSTIVAYLALFAALGGSATAATALKRNSVGSAQIRNGSVHVSDLAKSARPLTKARIASVVTDTMTSQQVLDALSGAVRGQNGAPGAKGDTGAQGAQGPAGVNAITRVAQHDSTALAQGQRGDMVIACPDGMVAIGGGLADQSPTRTVIASNLTDARTGWHLAYNSPSAPAPSGTDGWALCIPGSISG